MEKFKSLLDEYNDLIDAILEKPVKDNLINLDAQWDFPLQYDRIKDFIDKYLIPSYSLAAGDFAQNKKLPVISRSERLEIFDKEKHEREMILNDLKFSTHINISKFNEPITSRRFVAINDSCLSFTQITLDGNFYRWFFVSRSTEVNRMLPADFCSIGKIILEWTQWFNLYTKSSNEKNRGIKILFLLNNPHVYIK